MSESAQWQLGIVLGVVVIAVAAVIVITIVLLAMRIARAGQDRRGRRRGACASRPPSSRGIGQINDSGVRILHAARALRKVAVGK